MREEQFLKCDRGRKVQSEIISKKRNFMTINDIIMEFDKTFGDELDYQPIKDFLPIREAVKSFLRTSLSSYASFIEGNLREKIEGMKVKTCDCEEDPGYHTKDCNLMPFGYNNALYDVLALLDKKDI